MSAGTAATSRLVRDQAGSAIVEVTWLALLLMIPLVYVVLTFATVQRSAYGATEAARAAGRAYILAPDVVTAGRRAFGVAQVAMRDQGVSLHSGEMSVVCHPTMDACLQPGSTVEIRIELDVALPLTPGVAGGSVASIAVHAAHVEPFGVYREAGS
jgi:Flp pilus assembly protein TadG